MNRAPGVAALPYRKSKAPTVELLGVLERRDREMNVSDPHIRRQRGPLASAPAAASAVRSSASVNIVTCPSAASAGQAAAGPIDIQLESVALGIREIQRFTDAVIGRA